MKGRGRLIFNIAIDGPGGAGKSSISKALARDLGFIYVDTGALYRAVGLYALSRGADTKNEAQISALLPSIKTELVFIGGEQRVLLNGEDVSDRIRTQEVSMAASDVSALPCVRSFLFEQQRRLARENNCIMDGRDIGTVVLPEAQLKLFLTAGAQVRAQRRYKELLERGEEADLSRISAELEQRDLQDKSRKAAPLKAAEDALILDTSDLGFEEVLEKIKKLVKERI